MKDLIFFLTLLTCISCKNDNKNKSENNTDDLVNVQLEKSYVASGNDQLKNSKLTSWDTNAKPSDWEINNNFDKPELFVIDRDTLDLMLKGHKEERIFIQQNLSLEPNSYYVLETDVQTRLKHNSYAGVKLMVENEIVGLKVFEKNSRQMYKSIFKTTNATKLNCYIGFIEKGEGEVMIKSMTLKKVSFNINKFESETANIIQENSNLDFTQSENYDLNIKAVVKSISELLLAEKRNDTLNIGVKKRLLETLNESSYLKKILNEPKETATKSFTTKLVFSTNELLSLFNIGSRIIEFKANNKRVHLALMYHNPYLNQWVTIDPFYNSKINATADFELITKEQVSPADFGGLITNDIDGLLQKYNSSKATIQKEKIIGYPF